MVVHSGGARLTLQRLATSQHARGNTLQHLARCKHPRHAETSSQVSVRVRAVREASQVRSLRPTQRVVRARSKDVRSVIHCLAQTTEREHLRGLHADSAPACSTRTKIKVALVVEVNVVEPACAIIKRLARQHQRPSRARHRAAHHAGKHHAGRLRAHHARTTRERACKVRGIPAPAAITLARRRVHLVPGADVIAGLTVQRIIRTANRLTHRIQQPKTHSREVTQGTDSSHAMIVLPQAHVILHRRAGGLIDQLVTVQPRADAAHKATNRSTNRSTRSSTCAEEERTNRSTRARTSRRAAARARSDRTPLVRRRLVSVPLVQALLRCRLKLLSR